jgi:uncharacterized protein YbjT (DUF2867 family)
MAVDDVVVLGATGKVGRRVAARLDVAGATVRGVSTSGSPPFRWEDPDTWGPVVQGVDAAFVMAPDGVEVDPRLLEAAVDAGVRRLVLLSSKGIETMNDDRLLAAEQAVRNSGVDWTILRPDWFDQNFDEGFLRDAVLAGEVAIPIGDTRMAFNDLDDVAAVAATVLTHDGHADQTYELGGPEALSFAEATAIIAEVSGREVRFSGDADRYVEVMTGFGLPEEQLRAGVQAFQALADAGDGEVTDAVQMITDQSPVRFRRYAESAASRGAWAG